MCIRDSSLIGQSIRAIDLLSIGALKEYVAEGVLFGLVPDYTNLGRAAASILDRHRQGEPMSSISVYTKTNPKILINETTQKSLGIEIPSEISSAANMLN